MLLGSFLLFLERGGVRHAEERIIQRHLYCKADKRKGKQGHASVRNDIASFGYGRHSTTHGKWP